MTVILPPRMTQRGLEQFNQLNSAIGPRLKASWLLTNTQLPPLRGSRPRATAPTGCTFKPEVQNWRSAKLHAEVMAELGRVMDVSFTAPDWNVVADTVTIATITPPTPQAIDSAIANLVAEDEQNRPGLLGQRDWIALYFAHDAGLDPGTHRLVLDLLDAATNLAMLPTFEIKNEVRVPRPYERFRALKEVIEPVWHASWPAGHAVAAYTVASVLSRLTVPDARETARIEKLAKVISANRQKALVHTELDTAAGKTLGLAIGNWLADTATTNCDKFPIWASIWEFARQKMP